MSPRRPHDGPPMPAPPAGAPASGPFPSGGGAMGEAVRARDWSASPLGPIAGWPPALRNALNLVLNSGESMFVMWGEARTFFFNDAYRPMLGPRIATALGRDIAAVWADAWEQVVPVVGRALAGEGTRFEEVPIAMARYGRDEETWWTFSFSPLHDDAGAVAGMLGVTREVTEQVLMKRRLESEHAALVQMFAQAPSFIAVLKGPEHRFDFTNAAYLRLVGGREVAGRSVAEALPDAAAQGYVDLLDRVYRTGEPFSATGAEFVLQPEFGGTGERRWVDFIFQPLTDAGGAVTGILVEGYDVTARVEAEREVRASEARFGSLTQALPNQVWTATPDGTVDWANARLYEYSGAAELAGPAWTAIVHPDDLPAVGARWAAALATGGVYETEMRVRRRDGAFRWHLVRAVAQRDAAGAVERWVGTSTDIDDQKRAELTLAAAKAAAEEANLAKSQFLANMSHELRTPLSAIIGYAEMLKEEVADGTPPADLLADMDRIESNARHLLGLINDVLDLSKIESGKMEVYPERFALEPVLRELSAAVGGLVARKANRLELRLDPGLGGLDTDLTKLRQIVLNLLSNAAKFTERGTIALTAERAGDRVRVAVQDSGIGMTAEQVGRLFERFSQADISTTRRFGGSGLGLSLVRAYAEMLGGEVSVESEPGRGSTFTVLLPATLPSEKPAP